MPVTGETHFGECDDLNALAGGVDDEIAHAPEVVRLVAGRMLELYGSHANVTHVAI